MRILVTGGCGFVGSVLVPKLLAQGHHVDVIDAQWFGNYLKPHSRLNVVRADIRDKFPLTAQRIIHLAGIANDPTGELDPKLTWEVNALATMQLADRASRGAEVCQFIYASSGSVYGVSDAPEVTEDLPLVPLSEYNKTKMVAERVLLSYSEGISVQILRPATVCGYSPRMRLDVVVNMLTMQALTTGRITVLGGDQMRPNVHIEDMCDAYLWMLDREYLTGIYNVGFENMSVMDIAKAVAAQVPAEIVVKPSNDPRSYRISSKALLSTGFRPKKGVKDAISEIVEKYKAGQLKDETQCHNLRATPKAA